MTDYKKLIEDATEKRADKYFYNYRNPLKTPDVSLPGVYEVNKHHKQGAALPYELLLKAIEALIVVRDADCIGHIIYPTIHNTLSEIKQALTEAAK